MSPLSSEGAPQAEPRSNRLEEQTCPRSRTKLTDSRTDTPFATIEEAIEDIRRGRMVVVCDDENRENEGDLTHGGPVRDAGGGQLHGHAWPGPDLPGAHRRALQRARPQPDGGQERGPLPDRVHRLGRGPRRGHDRHLGGRPRPNHPGGHRPAFAAPGPGPAGPRLPAQGQGRRRPGAHRPDRGGRRPGPPRRPDPGRGDLRDHERGRDDGPRPRPGRLLRQARPEDGHGRRPDRLSAAHGEAGRADRLHQAADDVRRVHAPSATAP